MVDYRLASITKPETNQRYYSLAIQKKIFSSNFSFLIFRRTDPTNNSEITLESFIQSRQDERRVQHLHMGMRVPQYTAPPPPPGYNNNYYYKY